MEAIKVKLWSCWRAGCTALVVAVMAAMIGMAGAGCQPAGGRPSENSDDTGQAVLQLTSIPSDVNCVRVTATGASRAAVNTVDVSAGASSASIPLSGLPLGKVTFYAEAFAGTCSTITVSSVPGWVSDPVDASVVLGTVANVSLTMRRNGRASISADFAGEAACSANGAACLTGAECCSGSCSAAGTCAVACTSTDVAYNPNGSGYPSPLESDAGWGGGAQPWEILQGHTSYTDTWAHGLAFGGGTGSWNGQPCGTRQATVDFGQPRTVSRVLAWHHAGEHVPTAYHVEAWNGSAWVNVGGTSSRRTDLADYPPATGWGSEPTENLFPAITANKIRFVIDSNCDITHGWLYALQAFSACE